MPAEVSAVEASIFYQLIASASWDEVEAKINQVPSPHTPLSPTSALQDILYERFLCMTYNAVNLAVRRHQEDVVGQGACGTCRSECIKALWLTFCINLPFPRLLSRGS